MFTIIKNLISKNKRANFKKKMLEKKQVKILFLSKALFDMESIEIEHKFNVVVEKHTVYVEVYFSTFKELERLKKYNNTMEFYPPWVSVPGVLDISMYYKEGVGKEYLNFWLKWFLKYEMADRIQYLYLYDVGVHWLEALSFQGLEKTVEVYRNYLKDGLIL